MINIRDLRIGNWIATDDNLFMQVTLSTFSSLENSTGTYKPIPLTGDILSGCGFTYSGEDDKYSYARHFKSNLRIAYADGQYIFYYFDKLGGIILQDRLSSPILYLHQLQNIYYCLTGDELRLRLPAEVELTVAD